ncbi:HNH endonuclease [Pedobacter sp. Hv1]|uniref:HNH endonuclease n=1 Tax=Pedobacter sp. Hv1 TaxID=1740090 RepID=UPI0006D8C3B2|nr:HNH endonuclease [Pedobacter sp. Hv1]KQC02082.1 hypothetical protein AQF98_00475 [Pedobacter sp. Hv1]
MKKSDREFVFNKFGGKCAYCGNELLKGWHVDHKEPIGRRWKYVEGSAIIDGKKVNLTSREISRLKQEEFDMAKIEWFKTVKSIADGCDNPENECIENYMPACASCNILKSSMGLEGFRKTIANFINSLNLYHNQYKIAKRYGLVSETSNPVIFYFETFNNI